MLMVTAIFASLLAAIYLKLTLHVIALRRQNKVSIGNGGVSELERAIRSHGNFSEYTPIALILMACLELNGAMAWLVALFGLTFTAGRVFHAMGLKREPQSFDYRIRGMKLTINTLIALIASNIAWVLFKLISSIV